VTTGSSTRPSSSAAVEAIGFGASYRTREGMLAAVDRIDLTVAKGEFVAVIGPSGCGKSTFLRAVADLHRSEDTTGTLAVDGTTPEKARLARHVAFMFQKPALLPWLSLRDNVTVPLSVAGISKPAVTPDEMLARVGLSGFENALPQQCSGGMQQRAALARSLILTPAVVLMDEPFAAVDEITRENLNGQLLDIWTSSGSAVLFVTHSLEEAVYLADRVVVMSDRPARITGVVDAGLERPRRPELRGTQKFLALENEVRALLHDGGRPVAVAS
jgi:NitT/TauT family transport system ATP-binding protein